MLTDPMVTSSSTLCAPKSGRIRLNEDVPYLNVKQDNLQHMLIYLTLHNQLRPVSSPGIQGNHPRC